MAAKRKTTGPVSQSDISRAGVEALRTAGLLTGVGLSAFAAIVVGLAEQVDEHPENAQLWNQYRAAWKELHGLATDKHAAGADPVEELLAELSSGDT